jgi:uncharacterized protein with PIN domain
MTSERASLRFYGDLADLAWNTERTGEAHVIAAAPRSVKDAIESCGVPHTEVDLLLVNGRSVGFGHLVRAGDRVAVYPVFHGLDIDALSRVRPDPLPQDRFVLDVHLGRLAELLRHLGIDALYRNDLDDDDLAALSAAGPRWLLTRDRGLLMRRTVIYGYLVRDDDPRAQVFEVAHRFRLCEALAPFTRCARCNSELQPVDKSEVIDRLPPATRREHDEFVRCRGCGQVYWRGSHVGRLEGLVSDVRSAVCGGGEV